MIWSFYISYNKFILTKKKKLEMLNKNKNLFNIVNITQNKFHTNTQLIKENPSFIFQLFLSFWQNFKIILFWTKPYNNNKVEAVHRVVDNIGQNESHKTAPPMTHLHVSIFRPWDQLSPPLQLTQKKISNLCRPSPQLSQWDPNNAITTIFFFFLMNITTTSLQFNLSKKLWVMSWKQVADTR